MGVKTFDTCLVFQRLRDNVEYLLNETWQLGKVVGKYEGPPISSENFMDLGLQTVKIEPEVSLTHRKFCVLLRCQALHTANVTQLNFSKPEVNGADASRIRWRRIAIVNENIEIRLLMSRNPKHLNLAVASRRAAFSGNTSLIATFSSIIIQWQRCTYFCQKST